MKKNQFIIITINVFGSQNMNQDRCYSIVPISSFLFLYEFAVTSYYELVFIIFSPARINRKPISPQFSLHFVHKMFLVPRKNNNQNIYMPFKYFFRDIHEIEIIFDFNKNMYIVCTLRY